MDLSAPLMILAIALCFLLAGMVKGITGMGLPTVVMCTLVFFMPGAKAAALLVVPSLITNFWQLFSSPGWVATLRRLALMLIAIVIGTFVGIGYLTGRSSPSANIILGLVLGIYALLALRSVKFSVPPKWEPFIAPVAGLATGVLGGATGLFLVPAVPYIAALGLQRDQLIQALGLSFGISTISLALALTSRGAFNVQQVGASALALIPAMAGMYLGEIIRRRLSPELFRKWFHLTVLLVGLSMVIVALKK